MTLKEYLQTTDPLFLVLLGFCLNGIGICLLVLFVRLVRRVFGVAQREPAGPPDEWDAEDD